MTDLIVVWLREQFDEDERIAQTAMGGSIFDGTGIVTYNRHVGGSVVAVVPSHHARHIARYDPARVLAEIEAKRRILAEVPCTDLGRDALCRTAKLLALPYAGQ